MSVKYIDGNELAQLQSSGDKNFVVVDVRDERSDEGAHIAGSKHYASAAFDESVNKLLDDVKGKDKVIFHCALSQVRGPTCARAFLEKLQETPGAPDVYVLQRGFNGWAADGRPSCSCSDQHCTCTVIKPK
eukprot:jgi/Mesen1/6820/ME000035S06206